MHALLAVAVITTACGGEGQTGNACAAPASATETSAAPTSCEDTGGGGY